MHQAGLFNQVTTSQAHYKSNNISQTLIGDGTGVKPHCFNMVDSEGRNPKHANQILQDY